MMSLSPFRLFNSRTRKKERFSARGGRVGMYVCGITPYSVTHLGHASTYTHFDVLVRCLRHFGYRTTYVQNLTDIDDDILKRAAEEKRDWRELGETNAQRFLNDMAWLGNAPPDVYPRASDHIREIIALAEMLLQRGVAYEKNGSVYFHVAAYPRYGEISGLQKQKMLPIANERGNHPDDQNKKNPLDFVLWQKKKTGEPSWDSPWGPGRPCWHIECSAMAAEYLGATIDIHGGGGDLIFPHHESEEAQSRAAYARPLARWWMHTGMLRYKGEKMSKSLGNLVFVSDLKKRYGAAALRMYLLSHQYRSSFEFFERDIREVVIRERLLQSVWRIQSALGAVLNPAPYRERFFRALSDDMDTPQALNALEAMSRMMIRQKNKKSVAGAKAFMSEAFSILGLRIALSAHP